MSLYYLALDYDKVRLTSMLNELCRLKKKFSDVVFVLYESSNNHYHIRSNDPIKYEYAVEIMDYSWCSPDYSAFAKKSHSFTIRTSSKTKWHTDGSISIAPEPKPIYHI